MLIVFATSGLPFNGNSLQTGSLGGSETALISMARALAKRGHEVRVYCECDRPGVYDGVAYFSKDAFLQTCVMASVDVLIASRWFHFLAGPIPAGLRVLWLHDILTNEQEFMAGQFQTDLIMPLSDYHVENYCEKLPELRPFMWKTANGIDDQLVGECRKPKVPNKLIYTSRPERGLHFLLRDILPEIIKRKPDAKLYYANYDTSTIGAPDYVKQIVATCDQIAKGNPNHVVPMGHLNKQSLYQQISSAQLHLYPTEFPEIFCITAIEAQACGTPIITTDDFALRETVGPKSGCLIPGKPSDPVYIKQFADRVCNLLDDQAALLQMSQEGPKFVGEAGFVWDTIAEKWERKFTDTLNNRWNENKLRVIQQLEHTNDLATAEFVARREGLNERAAELQEALKAAKTPRATSGDVTQDFAAAQPLFSRLGGLLVHRNLHPKKILDYLANDVCFGLMLAKNYPDAEVVVRAVDAATADRIRTYASTSKLPNIKVITPADTVLSPTEKEFDLIFLGDILDEEPNPTATLKTVQSRYLSEKGSVLVSTRYGTQSQTKRGDGDRLWNFEFGDIRSMFRNKVPFDASFQDGTVSNRGELSGHWCWIFEKCTDFSLPSVTEKLQRTRPYQSLAVCMIAKNEADWLQGCLKSVSQVADKIVLVDTGSSDDTVAIANKHGVEVRSVAFDNFSQARNASIEGVAEDWILWVDADERLAGSDHMRKYLATSIFEGFGIRQNHLMLDIGKTYDVPIRLLRNRPYHRFTGLIHEHCERVDRKPFDDPINPVLVITDVDIVHYGYMNERVRRQKCSNRNMELLIRDVKESASRGRMLTWVLVIRDYLNFVKWSLERTQGRITHGSREHKLLCAAVATYRIKLGDEKSRYTCIAKPMYQEALQLLGRAGLPYGDSAYPPFEVGVVLTGSFGGIQDRNITPQTLWFLNHEEFVLHLQSKGIELATALGARKEQLPIQAVTPIASSEELPDPVSLLSSGLNVIPMRVA